MTTRTQTYEEWLAASVSRLESQFDKLSGLDERLDYLNAVGIPKIVNELRALQGLPPTEIVVPGAPTPGVIVPPLEVSTANVEELTLLATLTDLRQYFTMLYQLGRAYELRLFSYLTVISGATETYTYTIPREWVYFPHVDEIEYSSPREITRRDYEGDELKYTETYATDREVAYQMTPLTRTIQGSFAFTFYNPGASTIYVKSRFIATMLRSSDYRWWKERVTEMATKYLGAVG